MKKKYILSLSLYIIHSICTHQEPSFHTLLEHAKTSIREQKFDAAFHLLHNAFAIKSGSLDTDIELANNILWLGNHYFEYGNNTKALECFRLILAISPNISAAHHNIAFTLAERCGKHNEALTHYEQALALSPNNIETHFCAALSYLATGDLERGFKEYEYRWQRGINNSRNFLEPLANLWNGTDSLWGKTFLIRAEQGFGDTIQFIRYAHILKEKGAIVIAEVQKPLVHLLQQCHFLDDVIAIGSPLPLFDYQAPLLSLPTLTKTSLKNIPAPIPYIHPTPERQAYWNEKLHHEKRFKIGICWHGDPAHGPGKFMPLKALQPLLERKDVAIFSLQLHHGLEQLNDLPAAMRPHHFDATFDASHGSFMDTIAVMKELDLVISVDTSTAHVAGAMGVPVWILLPFPAEWRWLIDRHDSPWYPSMTLFRQPETRNWTPVVEEVIKTLETLLHAKHHAQLYS